MSAEWERAKRIVTKAAEDSETVGALIAEDSGDAFTKIAIHYLRQTEERATDGGLSEDQVDGEVALQVRHQVLQSVRRRLVFQQLEK